MTLESTFKPYPPKEDMERLIQSRKAHIQDLTSYMWYILPVAERFGDSVYDVAAQSLSERGIEVDAEQLRELAEDMQAPEKQEHYATKRHFHIGTNLTSDKTLA